MNNYCYSADIRMGKYKKTYFYKGVEMLKLTIKYPLISLPNRQAENIINNQIYMEVRNFKKHAEYLYEEAIKGFHEAQENSYPFHTYEAYMEYIITYNENCFLSLYYDRYEFTGGAHGSTIRASNTWELCLGTPLFLENFFPPGTDFRPFVTDEIIRQAEPIQRNEVIYFDDYKTLIIENFNEDSFYLSPGGITIYYQQYEIAPYSTGIVEFTIPYSSINWYPNC